MMATQVKSQNIINLCLTIKLWQVYTPRVVKLYKNEISVSTWKEGVKLLQ